MTIKRSQVPNGMVLELGGRLDGEAGNTLVEEITLLADGHTNIAVDMRGVPFVNSAGLASLITCLKRCRERRTTFKLLSLQPQVLEVFELTQLSHVFGMHRIQDQAA
ncbi:MAG TPA: STAS domain-containing protein [Candidatus Saccharimonadales bacterium]|nr:STAS domain-containing protein [Candidatus Saccharimonadales bacterium]